MDNKSMFWIYVIIIALLVIGLMLLWHFYMNEIVWTLGWLLVFALIFGAGIVVGRYSRRFSKREDENKEI